MNKSLAAHHVYSRLSDADRALPDLLYWKRVAEEATKVGDDWLNYYARERALASEAA